MILFAINLTRDLYIACNQNNMVWCKKYLIKVKLCGTDY